MAGIQRVVINQPGLRPGQPGAQITVPLSTLQVCPLVNHFRSFWIIPLCAQALQAGQGIPTGQPGHLLVKTETGQYQVDLVTHHLSQMCLQYFFLQILRVGPPGAGGTTTASPVTVQPSPQQVLIRKKRYLVEQKAYNVKEVHKTIQNFSPPMSLLLSSCLWWVHVCQC